MTTIADSQDLKELVAEHLSVVRAYARRVMLRNDSLTDAEEADKTRRMKELLAIGNCFKLTEYELVGQVYRDTLRPKRGCGCPTCRTRMVGAPREAA
ncbi:MAG: hypothetical protein FJ319_07155 [SAR202 cluster bacterium]|nr:hypothetical protein [SAR202 cluster bacterium]